MALSVKHLTNPLYRQRVVYHITIHSKTNHSEPYTGVNVCLINRDTQQAVLQHVSPYPVPFTKYLPVRHEFEGADIGDVHEVLFAPECGKLVVDEIEIDIIGSDKTLTFVQSSAHDNIFIPKREFSPELKAQYDAESSKLYEDINVRSWIYASIGTTFTAATLGPNEAYAFGIGAVLASVYNIMLQVDVDNLGSPKRLTADTATRLFTLTILAGLVVHNYSDEIRHHNIYYVLGLIGFLSYKMSIMRSIK